MAIFQWTKPFVIVKIRMIGLDNPAIDQIGTLGITKVWGGIEDSIHWKRAEGLEEELYYLGHKKIPDFSNL